MKKILLGTTTLIGAGLLSAAAFADTPKVTIGGYEDFQLGWAKDDLDSGSAAKPGSVEQRPNAFRSDTQITFRIDGKTDSGLGYGGGVDLLADTSADARDRGVNASKTFVYLDGMWGRTELGSEVGAEQALKVDASTIARATGGIAGDWVYYANSKTAFLATPDLPLAYGAWGSGNGLGLDETENLNKVTYYTPRFAGFQVGVSYLPDQTNNGQGTNICTTAGSTLGTSQACGPDRAENVAQAENILTGGVNYEGKFDEIGIAAAWTGEEGKSELHTYEDLRAWNAGLKLSYLGFSLAGSYGDDYNSNRLKTTDSGSSTYWTAGGAYEFGPFGASLTYMNSSLNCGNNADTVCATTGKDKLTNWSAGVDYKLAPGLTPYAEVSFFNENALGTVNDNKGTVGIVGTQLAF